MSACFLRNKHTQSAHKVCQKHQETFFKKYVFVYLLFCGINVCDRKKAMESELLKSKTELMTLNNQLLEAVQRRLEMAIELEAWKVGLNFLTCSSQNL